MVDRYGVSGPYRFGPDVGKDDAYIYRCAKVGECTKWLFVDDCKPYGGEIFSDDRNAAQPYKCHTSGEKDVKSVYVGIRNFLGEEGGGVIGSANAIELTISGAPQDAIWESVDMNTMMSYFSFYIKSRQISTDSFRLSRYNSGNIFGSISDLISAPENKLIAGSSVNGKYVLRIFCGDSAEAYSYTCLEKRFWGNQKFEIRFEKGLLSGEGYRNIDFDRIDAATEDTNIGAELEEDHAEFKLISISQPIYNMGAGRQTITYELKLNGEQIDILNYCYNVGGNGCDVAGLLDGSEPSIYMPTINLINDDSVAPDIADMNEITFFCNYWDDDPGKNRDFANDCLQNCNSQKFFLAVKSKLGHDDYIVSDRLTYGFESNYHCGADSE